MREHGPALRAVEAAPLDAPSHGAGPAGRWGMLGLAKPRIWLEWDDGYGTVFGLGRTELIFADKLALLKSQ